MERHTPSSLEQQLNCPYLTFREVLVENLIDLLRQRIVVVIRAPPMCGKSTLCALIGRRILLAHNDLDPVDLSWPSRFSDDWTSDWKTIMKDAKKTSLARNKKTRVADGLNHPEIPRKSVFLIDNAVNAYGTSQLWEAVFKNTGESAWGLILLICVHGSANGVHSWGDVPSESMKFPIEQRVELHANSKQPLQMLLGVDEIKQVIGRWEKTFGYKCDDSAKDFLAFETDGHVAVLEKILQHIRTRAQNQVKQEDRENKYFNARRCCDLMSKSFLRAFTDRDRGFWNVQSQQLLHKTIIAHLNKIARYSSITFEDIEAGIRLVAGTLNGVYKIAKVGLGCEVVRHPWYTILEACHKVGHLQTRETPEVIEYIFASKFHLRVAVAHLHVPKESLGSIRQISIDAMKIFRPTALTSRSDCPDDQWHIPEAAFQAEMYTCLKHELEGQVIFSEYAKDPTGRVDFYLPDLKSGIELLQNGTPAAIEEHLKRFLLCGRYGQWEIMESQVIINFCFDATHHDLRSTDLPKKYPALFVNLLQAVYDEQRKVLNVYDGFHNLVAGPFKLFEHSLDYPTEETYPGG